MTCRRDDANHDGSVRRQRGGWWASGPTPPCDTPAHASLQRGAIAIVLLVASIPRLWAAVRDQGIFWPDEIYQTLEPAHRFAFGYGFVAWEFQDGARSWLFPGFIGLLWKVASHLGITSAPALLTVVRAVLVCLSLSGLYVSMRLAERLAGRTAALLAGCLGAMFPAALIYDHHCLTEIVSGPILLLSIALVERRSARTILCAGGLAAAACFLRLPNAIVALGTVAVLLAARRSRDAAYYVASACGIGMAGGLLDWVTWGAPFHSLFTNVKYNLFEGNLSRYGVAPFGYYLNVAWTSTGVALVPIALGWIGSWSRARGWVAITVAYLLIHSAIPHKEYRFLMPIVPLVLTLSGVGLAVIVDRLAAAAKTGLQVDRIRILVAAGSLAMWLMMGIAAADATFAGMGQYVGEEQGGTSPWHSMEEGNRLLWEVGTKDDLCGLLVWGRHAIWLGGYTYLHRDVPWLTAQSPHDVMNLTESTNYLITVPGLPAPPGYAPVRALNGWALLQRAGKCSVPPPGYTRRFQKE
jgi:phosphatidylinositol glycan class B